MPIQKFTGKHGPFHVILPVPKKLRKAYDLYFAFVKTLTIKRIGKSGTEDLLYKFGDKKDTIRFSKKLKKDGWPISLDLQMVSGSTVTIKGKKVRPMFEGYATNLFNRKGIKARADSQGITSVENEDLTLKGLIAKAIAWDEGEHGIDKRMYNTFKKDIERLGGKMPKVRRLKESKPIGEGTMKIKMPKVRRLKEAKYALSLMKTPANTWVFRGNVPVDLSYVEKNGSPLKPETKEKLPHASNPAMLAKTRSFKSKDDALKAAKKLKISVNKIQIVGESTMKIKLSELKELVKEVLKEESTEYKAFFQKKLGDRKLGDMSDEDTKKFFAQVDKEWKAKNETLEPVSAAAGNPLKRVKAKKRDQILAGEAKKAEGLVRKIVREELKFVMFADKGSTVAGHKVKKRQIHTGEGV